MKQAEKTKVYGQCEHCGKYYILQDVEHDKVKCPTCNNETNNWNTEGFKM